MGKIVRTYRISEESDVLIKAEASRLAAQFNKKVSEADVIELAIVKWCSVDDVNTSVNTERRAVAEEAMKEAEEKPPSPKPTPRKAESVAQRKARETKEHVEKLAECDTLARKVGRDDIEYDPENTPYKSVLHVAASVNTSVERKHYKVAEREAKPLTRPHGSTEAKRRREQQ